MKPLFFIVFIIVSLNASDIDVLSPIKQNIIELEKQQSSEKERVNQYDWLSDITLNTSVIKDQNNNTTDDYSLTISQDIFKFGGIRSQIQYAKELKKMELLDIDVNTKEDLNTLFSTLIDIKLNDISLKQNLLNLKSSMIEVKHKTSEYKQGQLDISDLNNAIMAKNEYKDAAKGLKLTRLTNINTIKKYTTKSIEALSIPDIKLISKAFYLKQALSIQYAKATTKVNDALYKIKKSDYMPRLSVDAKMGYSEGDAYHYYGLSLNLPLSYSASNDIQHSRLEYLISQQKLNEEKRNAIIDYDSVILNIKNYHERIRLAQEDINLYQALLKTTQEEYEAGYKTIDDVQMLKNSMEIRKLDIQTYQLNIKKQLLSLYFKI
ncbi:TolC family protein [Sulfurospirillum sp. 1612]|uniref:TolC family protein n=1 Tax=Sulfurospirillum sp. 1612 TaxID=3094835 RepID=UPI002F948B7B